MFSRFVLGSPRFCTVAWTILPPRVVYGRIATSHSPSSSVNRSPILNCIGSTRVAAEAAACCGAGNGRPPRRATCEIRVGHQPQDREGARPDDSAVGAATRGPADRMINTEPNLTEPIERDPL